MAQNATRSNNRISNDITTPGHKTRSVVRDEARPRKSTEEEDAEEFEFYPAFCFPASPTHFTWVKMSIADIHRLHPRKGFEGMSYLPARTELIGESKKTGPETGSDG